MAMMAITQAKIGRFIKNLDMRSPLLLGCRCFQGFRRNRARLVSKSTAFTWVPGRAFCRPSTITRSPGLSPSLTSQLSPTVRAT